MINKSTTLRGIGITNKRVSGRLHFLKRQESTQKKRSGYNVGTELLRFEEAKKNALENVWEIEKRAKEIIKKKGYKLIPFSKIGEEFCNGILQGDNDAFSFRNPQDGNFITIKHGARPLNPEILYLK